MFTKQMREMERQAGVVTVRKREIRNVSKLPEGTYMYKDRVIDYLYNRNAGHTLCSTIDNRCDIYVTDDGTQFIPTSQIKIYMMADLFREMQCELVSVLITNKK
jgi:hypothetical protein